MPSPLREGPFIPTLIFIQIPCPPLRADNPQLWLQTAFSVTCKPFCGKTTSSEKPQNIL